MFSNALLASWRRAAMWFLVAVIGVAAAMLVLDGGHPAVAAGDCQYQPYGDPCPKVTPSLSTYPQPAEAQLGAWIYDRAALSGGNNPTGTITFALYQPGDDTCSNAVVSTQTEVRGNDDYYYSGSYPVDKVGTWRWTASYSGDDSNEPVSSGCSEEPVAVSKATPYASLWSVGWTTIGSTIWANGYVSGAFQGSGSVTVSLYRPVDPTCSGEPAYSQDFTLNGPGVWISTAFWPADQLGRWSYKLDYPGDANNQPVSLPCGTTFVDVVKATPYIWAGASPGTMQIGGQVTVNGQLAYGYQPTGTIAVSFFAPDDPGCSSPVETHDIPLDGGGTFSASFTPTSVGLWRMSASYAGDDFNNPTSNWCGAMSVDVSKASPSVFPAANPTAAQTGSRVQAFTLVPGGYQTGGRVAFRLYAPEDATCAGLPAYIEEASVVGGAAATSTGYVVPREGTWRWQAVYLGDESNNGTTSGCDQAPLSVVARLGTPPRDTGGTPFMTNVYGNCVDDHNIGVPYGSRLILRQGWTAVTERQIKSFLTGISTRAVVDGVPITNPDQRWGKPFVNSSGEWQTRWEYDTGRVVTAYTQPFAIEFQVVATKAGTDGFSTWKGGDVLISIGGPCVVAGYQPS